MFLAEYQYLTNTIAMKTILVAIDFSKNAEHALEYALVFAKKIDASIKLLWVDNTISEESVIDTIEGNLRREKKKYMEQLIKKYQPDLKSGKIEAVYRKGKVYQEVAKAARQVDADIIFSGTHGVSGYEQYWIGSNAYRIVTQAPCPVVTIRSEHNFKPSIKNILLPLDSVTLHSPDTMGFTHSSLYPASSDSQTTTFCFRLSHTAKLLDGPSFSRSLSLRSFPVSVLIR